jgi:hypothetical protein
MELVTAAEFSRLAGVSQMAISKALNPKNGKEPRLDYYKRTKKIDVQSVKAQAFLSNLDPRRGVGRNVATVIDHDTVDDDKKNDLTDALINAQNAGADKTVEEARLKKEQRIERQLKNAVRRGELIELEAVNQMIMTWFDRWLQANKRGFSGNFDGFLRDAFKLFENDLNADKKDFKLHDITKSKLKKRWSDSFESWADDGKQETIKYLKKIQENQARKK